jgi:hypothetical protein
MGGDLLIFVKVKSEGLAHNSYLIGAGGEAAVIDPRRDCDVYADLSRQYNLEITRIFETHRNEDYVIGSGELAKITGAEIFHGASLDFGYVRVYATEYPTSNTRCCRFAAYFGIDTLVPCECDNKFIVSFSVSSSCSNLCINNGIFIQLHFSIFDWFPLASYWIKSMTINSGSSCWFRLSLKSCHFQSSMKNHYHTRVPGGLYGLFWE